MVRKQLTKEQVEHIISFHGKWDTNVIIDLFNKNVEQDDNNKIKITPALYVVTDAMVLPPGVLKNQKNEINTTIGRFLLNSFLIEPCFGEHVEYVNEPWNSSMIATLQIQGSKLLQQKLIESDDMMRFFNRINMFSSYTEVFSPAASERLLVIQPEVKKLKNELLAKHKDIIDNNDTVGYVEKIEKPLLKLSEELLADEPSMGYFYSGYGASIDNNYNSNIVGMGPMINNTTGQFEIDPNSLCDGRTLDKYSLHANSLINASYNRAVNTQIGGYMSKLLFGALQTVKASKQGSDCGTTRHIRIKLTKDIIEEYSYRYIKNGSSYIVLTPEIMDKYIDKEVLIRSPLFCLTRDVCNKCLGDLFHIINVTNIGLTSTRVANSILNIALKQMHNTRVKVVDFDIFEHMKEIKQNKTA